MAAQSVTEACTKIANIAQVVNQLTSDKGEVNIDGRGVSYEVRGHFYRWKFIWDCEATDKQTGVSARATGHKSRNGSLEHGIKHLMAKLSAEGRI